MTTAVSSARYTDLYDYCTTATQINNDLTSQGGQLSNKLSHFEATCLEPSFRVGGDNLGGTLQSYSTWAMPIDRRVRKVGEDFQRADGVLLSRPVTTPKRRIDWRRLLGFAVFPPLIIMPLLPHVTQWMTANVSNFWTAVSTGATLAALSTLRISVSSIPGRVGVSAPHWARLILDLPSRHLKEATLASKLTKPVFGIGMLIAAGIKTYEQAKYNFEVFKDDELKKWTAVVYDAALILVATAAATGAAALIVTVGLPAIGITLAGVASAVATIGIAVSLGWAIDHFFLDPYLKGDRHKEHVSILAENLRFLKEDPTTFMQYLVPEFGNRLGENAKEFKQHPLEFTKVFGSELGRAIDEHTGISGHIKSHIDQFIDYVRGEPEPPPMCVAI
jgi:hypothetical protein